MVNVNLAEREIVNRESAGDRPSLVPQHPRACQRFAVVFACRRRPLSRLPTRQRVLRGTEAQTFDRHEPADGVAVGTAAEAVIVVVVDVT